MAAITLSSLPASRRVAAAALVSFITATCLTYIFLTSHLRNAYPHFPLSAVPDTACGGIDQLDTTFNGATGGVAQHAIPNIVHYVWLLKDPAEFRLSFKIFVSFYSAHLFWKPDTIFIHTDARPEVFDKARTYGDSWTRRVLALPAITPNFIQVPNLTDKGVRIVNQEHKADFVRMTALRDHGGVYLDTDAIPLRDIAALRNSGFANVIGGATGLRSRYSGYLNNGVMMSVKQSTLMNIFYSAAQEFFDGRWETASVWLLTDLANRMLPLPGEVLVLEPRAFAPLSWEMEDQTRLFKPRPNSINDAAIADQGAVPDAPRGPGGALSTCRDALAWLRQREVAPSSSRTDPREVDLSGSYVLHAFDGSIDGIWGWDRVIDVKYVVARQSTYARAVYPAVWHAVQAGIIPQQELA